MLGSIAVKTTTPRSASSISVCLFLIVVKNKSMRYCSLLSYMFLILSCSNSKQQLTQKTIQGIQGQEAFKHTSYITAGDRVYAIGSQDGGFPEIGWHVKDEMAGIWNHPIKLMDGFGASIRLGDTIETLSDASFVNFPYGNSFNYPTNKLGLQVRRFQFSPDQHQGMVIEYVIKNEGASDFEGTFEFQANFDLRPTWLGDRTNMVDAEDIMTFDQIENTVTVTDEMNPWFVSLSSTEPIIETKNIPSQYQGKGLSTQASIHLIVPGQSAKKINFFISGSYQSLQDNHSEMEYLKANHQALLAAKISKFEAIERQSRLTTSDPEFDEVFRWLKYNADWFIREVPEIGRGIAAGYPDYPWWFGCDSEYALKGYLSVGAFDLVKDNINLLAKLSRETNDNGRIIHEASTNGAVYNPGNLNETPQFTSLVWEAYQWTGDESLLIENFDLITQGLDWILNEMDLDRNGFPEGAGMMEIHGLTSEMIDVATYTQRAFEDAAKITAVLNKPDQSEGYQNIANDLKQKINDAFWVEDFNSFADFIADDAQTLALIDDAIVRADTLGKPWAVEELKLTKNYVIEHPSSSVRPFVLHHNWVVNTPMEMGIADRDKAIKALKTAEKFVNPYGVFVTGIDRDETAGKDIGSFQGSKVFSYTGAVMTLPTGVSAVAENNYGHPNQALDYLNRMGRSFSFALPGSIYEVSPDYGMFAQAWNLYSYAVPVVQQFFGINPKPWAKTIVISPFMPEDWDNARLENVKVGDNLLSINYVKNNDGYTLEVRSQNPDWNIEVTPQKGQITSKKTESDQIIFNITDITN